MLPTIVPLYGSFVLGIGEDQSLLLGLLLGTAFISSMCFVFLWRYVAVKIGIKRGLMISMTTFIITLIPLMFISDVLGGFIAFFLVGVGLSGSFFFIDVFISVIVDEDELNTGIRREGSYFGIHALIVRLSTVLIYLTISIVFNTVGWTVFSQLGSDEATIIGLRSLMFIFPAIFLGLGIISLSRFPITKEKYIHLKQNIEDLHAKKMEKVQDI